MAAVIILILLLVDRQQIIANKNKWKEEVFELREKNSELREENHEHYEKVNFVDKYVVFVEADGSNWYHKYECPLFEKQRFWVYGINTAEDKYSACPMCH